MRTERARRTFSSVACVVLAACASAHVGPEPSLFDYERDGLEVTVHDGREETGFALIDLEYASPGEGRVPAHLYQPSEPAADPAPAVLLMHGVPGTRASLSGLAEAYARAGVFALTISGPWARPASYRGWRILPAPLFNEHDRAELIRVVQELRRAVDLLRADPRIDGNRIGFVGHSAGAMAGALLAGVEDRIIAFALMAPTSGWVTWIRDRSRKRGTYVLDRLITDPYDDLSVEEREAWIAGLEPLDATRWIGRAEGTPLLIQGGTRDRAVSRSTLESVFAAASEPKALRWYDVGHAMGAVVFSDQARFLSKHLGFDESRFTPPSGL